MSTTDHPNTVAPQCSTSDLGPISVLREAVAPIDTGVHTSIAEATDQLAALAHGSGHHPLCVASDVAQLADPTGRPHPGLGAVHLRWAPPVHQRRHPPQQVPERVWDIVLAATAPLCRCLSCVLPVAGHHHRCPLYRSS